MTDEEITRRIAKLEGFTIWPGDKFRYSPPPDAGKFQGIYCGHGEPDGSGYGWAYRNWLSDWSVLGPLVEKHRCHIVPIIEEDLTVSGWSVCKGKRVGCYRSAFHESLPHAILLAIIEAHE